MQFVLHVEESGEERVVNYSSPNLDERIVSAMEFRLGYRRKT
ncbi:MAG: hypothetical protein WC715_00685 [Patescibacteria group bacterium]